eukprot:Platyproteum_vivax@DN7669_c0_g1_i3.p1
MHYTPDNFYNWTICNEAKDNYKCKPYVDAKGQVGGEFLVPSLVPKDTNIDILALLTNPPKIMANNKFEITAYHGNQELTKPSEHLIPQTYYGIELNCTISNMIKSDNIGKLYQPTDMIVNFTSFNEDAPFDKDHVVYIYLPWFQLPKVNEVKIIPPSLDYKKHSSDHMMVKGFDGMTGSFQLLDSNVTHEVGDFKVQTHVVKNGVTTHKQVNPKSQFKIYDKGTITGQPRSEEPRIDKETVWKFELALSAPVTEGSFIVVNCTSHAFFDFSKCTTDLVGGKKCVITDHAMKFDLAPLKKPGKITFTVPITTNSEPGETKWDIVITNKYNLETHANHALSGVKVWEGGTFSGTVTCDVLGINTPTKCTFDLTHTGPPMIPARVIAIRHKDVDFSICAKGVVERIQNCQGIKGRAYVTFGKVYSSALLFTIEYEHLVEGQIDYDVTVDYYGMSLYSGKIKSPVFQALPSMKEASVSYTTTANERSRIFFQFVPRLFSFDGVGILEIESKTDGFKLSTVVVPKLGDKVRLIKIEDGEVEDTGHFSDATKVWFGNITVETNSEYSVVMDVTKPSGTAEGEFVMTLLDDTTEAVERSEVKGPALTGRDIVSGVNLSLRDGKWHTETIATASMDIKQSANPLVCSVKLIKGMITQRRARMEKAFVLEGVDDATIKGYNSYGKEVFSTQIVKPTEAPPADSRSLLDVDVDPADDIVEMRVTSADTVNGGTRVTVKFPITTPGEQVYKDMSGIIELRVLDGSKMLHQHVIPYVWDSGAFLLAPCLFLFMIAV